MIHTKKEYIDFFTHMQKEHKEDSLGGMAWDEVMWWIHDAIKVDKLFTFSELKSLFPYLFYFITEDSESIS